MKPDYYVIHFYTGNTVSSTNNYSRACCTAEEQTRSTGEKHVVVKSICLYKPVTGATREDYEEF